MLYVDIPTAADIRALISARGTACVSIYLPTTPITPQAAGDRIALKNMAKEAVERLAAAGADKRLAADIAEHLDDLAEDDEFWRFQARSLAIFATPDNVRTFRVPNALQPLVMVSDRFHVKPLLRAVSFPNACRVLALAQRSVRLVEVSHDLPAAAVPVAGMPDDAGTAIRGTGLGGRRPLDRQPRAVETRKSQLRQFARRIDQALRPLLAGDGLPLVLAAAEPLATIYRSVNTYPHLADQAIEGNPEALTDAELADRARPVLDALYRRRIADWRELYALREGQGRATTDIAQAARAATMGAVDSMLADIDETTMGRIDDDGAVTFADAGDGTSYGLVDEIAARVIATGGHVIGVRRPDIPRGNPLAAVLRHPV
jgi:hypothetical protein